MGNELSVPKTLQQAIIFYADEQNCLDFMVETRWPDGVRCPRCGDAAVTLIERKTRQQDRTIWKCNGCKKQFSAKIGTVFEDSPLPLSKWLPALWLFTGAKNGISSCEVARALGVTQRTAWFMMHRIREAISLGTVEKFRGTVEADETFIGGLEKNKHEDKKLKKGRGPVGKTIVMGVLERAEKTDSKDKAAKSRVRAKVIQNRAEKTLHAEIKKEVTAFSEGVYDDIDIEILHKLHQIPQAQ